MDVRCLSMRVRPLGVAMRRLCMNVRRRVVGVRTLHMCVALHRIGLNGSDDVTCVSTRVHFRADQGVRVASSLPTCSDFENSPGLAALNRSGGMESSISIADTPAASSSWAKAVNWSMVIAVSAEPCIIKICPRVLV